MIGPRADWVCNSPKCRTDEGAPVYELPISAKRCPVCGSTRIVRLYNKVNVATGAQPDHFNGQATSSSFARRLDNLVEQPMVEALAKRDELKRGLLPGQRWHGDNGMVRPVALNRFPQEMQKMYAGQADKMGENPMERVAVAGSKEERRAAAEARGVRHDGVLGALGKSPIPRNVVARDTKYQVVKGVDGGPAPGVAS